MLGPDGKIRVLLVFRFGLLQAVIRDGAEWSRFCAQVASYGESLDDYAVRVPGASDGTLRRYRQGQAAIG